MWTLMLLSSFLMTHLNVERHNIFYFLTAVPVQRSSARSEPVGIPVMPLRRGGVHRRPFGLARAHQLRARSGPAERVTKRLTLRLGRFTITPRKRRVARRLGGFATTLSDGSSNGDSDDDPQRDSIMTQTSTRMVVTRTGARAVRPRPRRLPASPAQPQRPGRRRIPRPAARAAAGERRG